jgi:hypothetical protein
MNGRKSIPKTALSCIYYIDSEIAAGKYPNTGTLARDYETGTATISRDIEYMWDMLGAPIEYDYTRILTKQRITLPKNWDYRGHVEGSFLGVYTNSKKRRFRIAFSMTPPRASGNAAGFIPFLFCQIEMRAVFISTIIRVNK